MNQYEIFGRIRNFAIRTINVRIRNVRLAIPYEIQNFFFKNTNRIHQNKDLFSRSMNHDSEINFGTKWSETYGF